MDVSNYWQRVAGEVRAEMARQHKQPSELAEIIGLKTVAVAKDRMNGVSPFDLVEIEAVGNWLAVPLDALVMPPKPVAA